MSDVLEFDLSGAFKAFDKSVEDVLESAIIGVHDAVDDLLDKSRDEAPLKKGTLRTTAGSSVEVDGNVVTGEVFYSATETSKSGERVNYAVILHEMGEFKNPTTPGTRPKWLERPLKRDAKKYNRMIASAIRKGLRK
ncbi:HK97 gp10 family phage protein [uncultured Paenibacillus sp.]|uniref:HK97 gp10 family phage protein n=1 Tax=uncultured Paenibacillus sp. TaxID=227322 RepID=UPI0015AEBDB0|nr:HK97 gp10 family phage protein [uncultured Paenibacillus sp.]DAW22590.1 MAG TPA: Minor capsid protein [Caudoviricetes sp.]